MNIKKSSEELVVIQKLYDYLVWVSPIINRLPRDKKYTIGDRLLNRLYDVLEDLIKAKYRSCNKLELLEQANVGLEIVRFYQRLIFSDNLWDRKRYQFASKSVNEVGILLGKWVLSIKGANEKSR
ncbi:MAG TPA: diversity-generating retroelement protein Avd [Candidatus Dadabacteria bacterium]|nr:diversity-generating retroelement protein Avd [Candidatus Dadabacteria bacterium]